ncbi:MAG: hypothetical protein ACXAE3_14390 [Candidatus Kariarchaeaceae archaeon]|jgi:transcription initiation factor IIE alpha subunit
MSAEHQQVLDKITHEMGNIAADVVRILLSSEDPITIEHMEEKLSQVDIKDIRLVLYRLTDKGYARSSRLRDNETGWINFLWTLFPDRILR